MGHSDSRSDTRADVAEPEVERDAGLVGGRPEGGTDGGCASNGGEAVLMAVSFGLLSIEDIPRAQNKERDLSSAMVSGVRWRRR